jgi:hypothetical protein
MGSSKQTGFGSGLVQVQASSRALTILVTSHAHNCTCFLTFVHSSTHSTAGNTETPLEKEAKGGKRYKTRVLLTDSVPERTNQPKGRNKTR